MDVLLVAVISQRYVQEWRAKVGGMVDVIRLGSL